MRSPLRSLTLLAAMVAASAWLAAPASAQMGAAALGKPLPAADLEPGTVTVRVMKGTMDEPMIGIDVQLIDGAGNARTARTNADGRATFVGLAPGDGYVVRVDVLEGETQSEAFTLPPSGGIRLMLSPVPWKDGGAAGGPGMPSTRDRSGMPLPEGSIPPGTLSVLVVHGSEQRPAGNALVHLVGYDAQGGATLETRVADAGGRLRFERLSLDKVYYVMTALGRDGGADRLRSVPVTMVPGVGARMILSAAEDGQPVDDLDRMVEPQGATPLGAGEVLVRLRGRTQGIGEVELVAVGSPEIIARGATRTPRLEAKDIQVQVRGPMADPQLDDGRLVVAVVRMFGDAPQPVSGMPVEVLRVRPEGDETVLTQTTPQNGFTVFEGLEAGASYRAVASVHGKRVESETFTLPAKGGMHLAVMAQWDADAAAEALLTGVPHDPEKVYVAQVRAGGELYRSAPFQLLPERGAAVGIIVYDKLLFSFHLVGEVSDKYMGFQGQLVLQNPSWEPYQTDRAGVHIPLPKGHVGATVADEDAERVKVVEGGLLWKGIVPPGGSKFLAGFSMPLNEGAFEFDLPLPYGALESNVNFMFTPGLKIDAPQEPQLRTTRAGLQLYSISPINIQAQQRMIMRVSGAPHPPAWHRHVRHGIGLAVVAMIGAAIFVVLSPARRRAAQAAQAERLDLEQRRERLLDELVDLEQRRQSGKVEGAAYERARGKLRRDLEEVYARLEEHQL